MKNTKSDTISEKIKAGLPGITSKWEEAGPIKVFFDVLPAELKTAVSFLMGELNLRFIIATGTDTRRTIEILYHFADDNSGKVYSARVVLSDKKNLKIDSLSGLFVGASWIEREIHELLGVTFVGHDNPKHLLLNDDWPKNNFPLRHDNER